MRESVNIEVIGLNNIESVDLADCLISLYRINIRSKKYYHKLIFQMIDMAIVNSWLLYRRDAEALKVCKKTILPLAFFKLRLAYALMKSGKCMKRSNAGRPSSLQNKLKVSHSLAPHPDNSIRYDNVGHLPIIEKDRKMCKMFSCKGRTNVTCSKCNVNLCLNHKNNCYVLFHTK